MNKLAGEGYFNLHILTCINGHFYSKELTLNLPKFIIMAILQKTYLQQNISGGKNVLL